jgi:hypothetical protein
MKVFRLDARCMVWEEGRQTGGMHDMALDTKPDNHAERDQIVSAANAYRAGSAPDADVVALDGRIFAEPRTQYVGARGDYQRSVAAQRTASDAADHKDEAFDTAFRLWVRTVNDPQGKSLSGQLSTFMGNTKPAELVNLPYRKELTKVDSLFNKLPENPQLQGDPAKLAALKTVVAEFGTFVDADEAATRDMLNKGKALATATVDFDKSYTKFLRAVRALLGDEATFAIFPRFVRPDPVVPPVPGTPPGPPA